MKGGAGLESVQDRGVQLEERERGRGEERVRREGEERVRGRERREKGKRMVRKEK